MESEKAKEYYLRMKGAMRTKKINNEVNKFHKP